MNVIIPTRFGVTVDGTSVEVLRGTLHPPTCADTNFHLATAVRTDRVNGDLGVSDCAAVPFGNH